MRPITERIGQLPIRQSPTVLRQFYQSRKSWQTFGRLRLELDQFIQRERDFSRRSS